MIILGIALGGGLLVGLLLGVWLPLVEAVLPALALAVVAYVVMSRRAGKRVEGVILAAHRELMAGRIDKSIAMIEGARRFSRWQFFLDRALNSQLGTVHFVREDYSKALPMLEKSDPRHWIAQAMLAVLYYRKKDWARLDKTFETAARYSPKQGLLYGVWAWCHWKNDKDDKANQRAMEILARGDKAVEGKDDRLKQNLLNLQNGKKMKLKGYGDQWYQFRLEKMPLPQPQVRHR